MALVLTAGCRPGVDNHAGNATSTPGAAITPTATKRPSGQKIHWLTSFDATLVEAQKTKKPIMVDFFATWCLPCKVLDTKIYTDESVIEQSDNWVAAKINVEKNKALAQKYKIDALPTIVFLNSDGTVISGFKGVPKASRLAEVMAELRLKAKPPQE